MKIACIYFPISSVGGISTVAKMLKRAALMTGDTFDVLRSSNAKTIKPQLFSQPSRIRGGDTFIDIDGEAPHGEQFGSTVEFLEKNYDALFFLHPCCHPTKAYGTNPRWLDMYTDVKLPKATRFSDGYSETYEWVRDAIPECSGVFVDQEAYAIPLKTLGIAAELMPQPFLPFPATEERAKLRLTIFPNQWKQIKCPREFLLAMPKTKGDVQLFSNGIEYYNLRDTPEFVNAVGFDAFRQMKLSGPPRRKFHGCVTVEEMYKWFQRSWSMVDLMGQRAKHGAYRSGAYNYTAVEALYYGCRPILHDQARKSALPQDLIRTIDLGPKYEFTDRIAVAANAAEPLTNSERARAREWIQARHDATTLLRKLKRRLK